MAPWDQLAQQLLDLIDAQAPEDRVDGNVYAQAPASGALAVPAWVIRPDNPWQELNERKSFTRTVERYAIVCVVQASADAADLLRRMTILARRADSPWSWQRTDGIVQATEGGIDYLAATVRMEYTAAEGY